MLHYRQMSHSEREKMKTAVVFYSMSGNTKYAAEEIAKALGADLIALVPKKTYPDSGFKKFFWGGKSAVMGEKPKLEPYVFDAAAYDLIILGAPVWAGTFAPPLRTFIHEQRDALQGKRLAAFFCCSGGPGKVLEKLRAYLNGQPERELILIDPKDKPSSEADLMIDDFCAALQ